MIRQPSAESNSLTMHDLPLSDRPRERARRLGMAALSDQELLMLILGRGTTGEPVMAIAQRLLALFGNLGGIADASLEELAKLKGIGLAKATQIKAACELANRLENALPELIKMPVSTPEDVLRLARGYLKGKKKEYFLAILLDTGNQLIRVAEISVGSLDCNIVHPREVFKEAVAASAAAVIFVHNHPSGNIQPSDDDIKLTERLVAAGKIMGIDVLDHIIFADGAFMSMKREELF